jgi:hypothetical protein
VNSLDELLSTTGQADDIAPAGLRRGRAALDSAITAARDAQSAAQQTQSLRRLALPRHSGMRGRLIAAGAAAAAAIVAVTTITVLANHSSGSQALPSTHSSGSQAGPSTSAAPNSGTDMTAAVLLRAIGKVAGAQQGGWPNAAYWHVVSVYVSSGKTYHREIWISHHGNGVLEDNGVGLGPIDIGTGSFEGLTWAQLYALPTDPAGLQQMLESKFTRGFGSDVDPTPSPGEVSQSAELFVVVGDLLRESPAPPALREALYEVAANIPGVVVKGGYTDALGRTGTAVERSGETLVIDPGNGQLLADIEGDPNGTEHCSAKIPDDCSDSGSGYTYVSQGPATSAPPATSTP